MQNDGDASGWEIEAIDKNGENWTLNTETLIEAWQPKSERKRRGEGLDENKMAL